MNIHVLEKLDDEDWEILNKNFIKKKKFLLCIIDLVINAIYQVFIIITDQFLIALS